MGKYIFAVVFVLFLALNVAGYLYIVLELDGSTVKTSRTVAPQQDREDQRRR
jgi:hypothetical protein